eukprot:GHVU01161772.1.p2 GENE.GHVU01161772.1~~GHVU01161772.1.p2  ORF type:complete len:103 (+),score=17.33 GHVU01161772.1:1325-1633(+)
MLVLTPEHAYSMEGDGDRGWMEIGIYIYASYSLIHDIIIIIISQHRRLADATLIRIGDLLSAAAAAAVRPELSEGPSINHHDPTTTKKGIIYIITSSISNRN